MPPRDIPHGTSGGLQRPTNRSYVSRWTESSNRWERFGGDWAWWDVVEYDQEKFQYGGCNAPLKYSVTETQSWTLSASGGVSAKGTAGLSAERSGVSGNIGAEWASQQSFGYAQTGGTAVTLSGEIPARQGYRPVLILQFRVREYDIDYYDYHWTSYTHHRVSIKFYSLIGVDHGYIPCG